LYDIRQLKPAAGYFASAGFFSFSGRWEEPIAGEPASEGCPFGYPDSDTPVMELRFDSGVPHPHPEQRASREIPAKVMSLRKEIMGPLVI
jgi:hypothetical protein